MSSIAGLMSWGLGDEMWKHRLEARAERQVGRKVNVGASRRDGRTDRMASIHELCIQNVAGGNSSAAG